MRRVNVTFLAGLALAGISLTSSAHGLISLFHGALFAVALAIALEFGKLAGTLYLITSWRLRPMPIAISFVVLCLVCISTVGLWGYLGQQVNAGQRNAAVSSQTVTNTRDEVASLERDRARLDALVQSQPPLYRRRMYAQVAPQLMRMDSLLREKRAELSRSREVATGRQQDIGQLRYAAEALGVEQTAFVRWFIAAIALLLDPMAVLLILASGVKQASAKREEMELDDPEEPDYPPTEVWATDGLGGRYRYPQSQGNGAGDVIRIHPEVHNSLEVPEEVPGERDVSTVKSWDDIALSPDLQVPLQERKPCQFEFADDDPPPRQRAQWPQPAGAT